MHVLHEIAIKETPTYHYSFLLKPPYVPAHHPHHVCPSFTRNHGPELCIEPSPDLKKIIIPFMFAFHKNRTL